ncbi:hypothetical protein L7F22_044442 [Adiantum nelumboides]|nr:hypothetical protein [Adiantum nelumboides]
MVRTNLDHILLSMQNQKSRKPTETRLFQSLSFQRTSMESLSMEVNTWPLSGQSRDFGSLRSNPDLRSRASADLLPSYFYASNPYATQSSNDVTMEGTEKLPNEEDGAEEEGIPSNEWRETFVERFSNMREAIRNTPTLPFNANSPASKANLPSAGDKNAWYHFIYRAKVSSLIDTTLTPLPIANSVPQPEVSVSVSEYIPEEQKEMEQSDSSLDQEMAQPETDAASKVQTNLQTPNLGSRQNEACPQMLEEEMELYQEQLSEQKNPLKRKAIEDGGVEGEIGEVSDVELTLKEEKKRQKKANRNEPRSLRFPSPSLMRRFDLQTSLELIGYITEWIQTPNPTTTDTIAQSTSTSTSTTNPTDPSSTSSPTAISDFLSLWTFSLLSELDRNLLSDEISVLRELVRSVIEALKLWRMRKKLLDSMSKSKEKEKNQRELDL